MTAAAVAVESSPQACAVVSRVHDAPAFDESLRDIEASIERDRSSGIIEVDAFPLLLHHGRQTDNAVVLFHGFTNCPRQFDELARAFYARGCNVYVPRIPLHGYRDRLTHALKALDNPMLAVATHESYRLTRGLGRRVSAVGLSLGGTMALFLAQTQPIDMAVALAPFLMPIGLPERAGYAAMKVVQMLPDWYVWWDPRVKEKCLPPYAYPGFPSHSLAECIFFGDYVVKAARERRKPAGRGCTLVTNTSESAVNNSVALRVLNGWNATGAGYRHVELLGLGKPVHDIIDPTTFPQGRTLVYPRLEEIVLGAALRS